MIQAHAQNSAEPTFHDEIIVTATKRPENLLDVPLAVAVVDGSVLDHQAIDDPEEMSWRMPSVTVSKSIQATNIFIRGVGSGQNAGFEQSVGLFIDGAYYSRGRSFQSPFFDVERVEVLKGPQTVLFGKNVIGGALNIETRKPTFNWQGYVNVNWDPEYEGQKYVAVASGPLSEQLAFRLAAQYYSRDSYFHNTLKGAEDPDQPEQFLIRSSFLWEISEDVSAYLKTEFGKIDITGGYVGQPTLMAEDHLALLREVDPLAEAELDYQVSMPGTNDPVFDHLFNDTQIQNHIFTLNWALAERNSEITAITAYHSFGFDALTNNDYVNLNVAAGPQDQAAHTFSQEIRIASTGSDFWDYIAGVYYSDDHLDTRIQAAIDLSESSIAGVFPSDRLGRNQRFSQRNQSWAAFGEVGLNFSQDLRLKLGLRYVDDRKTADKDLYYSQISLDREVPRDAELAEAFDGVFGNEHDLNDIRRDTSGLPFSIIGEYDVNDDVMTYAYYKRGFKAGGFDEGLISGSVEEFEYDDEEVKAFAIGAKWALDGESAFVTAEIFHAEYSDLQVSTFESVGYVVGNAAAATSQGLDVEGRWRPNVNFTLSASFSWLHAEYDDYRQGPCRADETGQAIDTFCDLTGQPLQFAPEKELSASVEYKHPVRDWDGSLGLTLGLAYSDEFFLAGDLDPDIMQDAYAKLNASIDFSDSADTYRFSIIGKNLTNVATTHQGTDIPIASLYGGKGVGMFVDPPRTVSLQVQVNF